MEKLKDDIPQIKPQSILDPPQIKPSQHEGSVVSSKTQVSTPQITYNSKPVKKRRSKKLVKIFSTLLLVLVVFSLILGIFVGIPGYKLYKKALSLEVEAKKLKDSVNTQDISVVKSELNNFKGSLSDFEKSYNNFSWSKPIPKVGAYWKDGKAGLNAAKYGIETAELVIQTIEPYADIIGFAGANSREAKSGEDTANDRIEFLIQSVKEILPKMDEIIQKANLAKAEIDTIDPQRYPLEFKGKKIRSNLEKVVELSDEGITMLTQSKPLLEAAPYLLGIDEERTYLLLFLNDKELRPVGGFITAYSVMKVNNGKLSQVSSSDIYNLDNKYKPTIAAPEIFLKYLKGPYAVSNTYRLRDMNWSPDFKVGMDMFTQEAKKAGLTGYDGIIAVDTQVVVNILDVIGEIGVSGFGNFSTKVDSRCNCPQVIYELESFADVEGPVVWSENEPGKIVFAPKNYDNRKKIVGPLMNSVLANALGQPKDKVKDLFMAGWNSITQKHILVYLLDEQAQVAAENFNIAGRIKETQGDYLHISDANLGGRKSNLYVTQEVHQQVDIARDGSVEKTLEITYKNTQDYDGWLNSVLPNWTRIYVPKGSELISIEGFDDSGETEEELGKTVFSGGFQLRPQGVKKIVVKYKIPIKFQKSYEILIQKQPGTDMPLHTLEIGRQKEEFYLRTDKQFKLSI